MNPWLRRALTGTGVLGLSAALLALGLAAGSPSDPAPSAGPVSARTASLTDGITGLQSELERLPTNHVAWAQLGSAYVEQARLTADPAYYAKADGALTRSLELQPADNDTALTGQASLAAARHDFSAALRLADEALTINSSGATAYAVKTDALVELGRYEQARVALQRMLDLRPGIGAFTRASYALELQGDVAGARTALERALGVATTPADEAFVHYYLGELAWNSGDLPGARTAYEAGLAADPGYVPARAGLAKVLAASGDVEAAVREYDQVVSQQPQPEFLVQYGELLEASGDSAAAQEQYDVVRATQQLFAANGQDVDTELAVFEADHGTAEAALVSAERAYRARPDAIFTQDAYAWALHAAGRSQEALPVARQAVRTGLRLPGLHYRLGVIEAAAGEQDAARASLTTALELNSAFSPLHAPRAERLLASMG
jgi:tetratricopeptide (TPR) repeat protein